MSTDVVWKGIDGIGQSPKESRLLFILFDLNLLDEEHRLDEGVGHESAFRDSAGVDKGRGLRPRLGIRRDQLAEVGDQIGRDFPRRL